MNTLKDGLGPVSLYQNEKNPLFVVVNETDMQVSLNIVVRKSLALKSDAEKF